MIQAIPGRSWLYGARMAYDDKRLWELSRDEQRLLLITFAGGLASIVVGAVMVGGSIALAQYWRHNGGLSGLAIYTATNVAVVLASWSTVRLVQGSKDRTVLVIGRFPALLISRVVWTLAILTSILLASVLLTWIGVGAGVK
jgi:hypothetical protein